MKKKDSEMESIPADLNFRPVASLPRLLVL
jgi:hypothetical protein